jgi:cytochrome c biogenesis protein CcmG, thiol:disulfide interchange protein DsbE
MNDIQSDTSINQSTGKKPAVGVIVVVIFLVGFLIFLWLGLLRTNQGPVVVGQKIKDFSLQTFDGRTINTADLQGKVILVNFWASWCKPCESEAQFMQNTWSYYEPGKKVVYLGIDYVDTEPEAKASMAKYNITYLNGPDLGTRISQQFRIRGVPETYIIDQSGKLINIQIGPFSSEDDIKKIIDPLLK